MQPFDCYMHFESCYDSYACSCRFSCSNKCLFSFQFWVGADHNQHVWCDIKGRIPTSIHLYVVNYERNFNYIFQVLSGRRVTNSCLQYGLYSWSQPTSAKSYPLFILAKHFASKLVHWYLRFNKIGAIGRSYRNIWSFVINYAKFGLGANNHRWKPSWSLLLQIDWYFCGYWQSCTNLNFT